MKRFGSPDGPTASTVHRASRLDLIVSSDDEALQFLLKHRVELFGNVPVVFSGVSSPELIQQVPRDVYTGVVEEFDLQGYLDTALRLFPKNRHVFVVAGSILHLWAIFDCMVLSRL